MREFWFDFLWDFFVQAEMTSETLRVGFSIQQCDRSQAGKQQICSLSGWPGSAPCQSQMMQLCLYELFGKKCHYEKVERKRRWGRGPRALFMKTRCIMLDLSLLPLPVFCSLLMGAQRVRKTNMHWKQCMGFLFLLESFNKFFLNKFSITGWKDVLPLSAFAQPRCCQYHTSTRS